jgi:hypothetical protein
LPDEHRSITLKMDRFLCHPDITLIQGIMGGQEKKGMTAYGALWGREHEHENGFSALNLGPLFESIQIGLDGAVFLLEQQVSFDQVAEINPTQIVFQPAIDQLN